MLCYPCAEQGVQQAAVALCRVCTAGLCLDHLRSTASRAARGRLLDSCGHGTWDVIEGASTAEGHALHDAPLGDRVDITILAPELKFINASMTADQPFRPQRVRGVRLKDAAAEFGARWVRGAINRVEHEAHRVVTKDAYELAYDYLVLAWGAHPEREWSGAGVLT